MRPSATTTLKWAFPCRIVNLGATDIMAIINDDLVLRIQVKTAYRTYDSRYENPKPYYGFNVCRGSKVKRRFEEHEIDIIACVGLDDGSIMFYPAKQLIKENTQSESTPFEDYSITQETWEKTIRPTLWVICI